MYQKILVIASFAHLMIGQRTCYGRGGNKKPFTYISMAKAVQHQNLGETTEGEKVNTSGIGEITKKVIAIEGKDLTLVMNATKLSRNQSIELIQKANGNIKEALELFVNQ